MPTYIIAGCVGGAAGVLVGHPFDTVKVTLQTQAPGQYRGAYHCFASILRREGFSGLFKGLSSPLASLSFINAIIFGVYGNTVKRLDNHHSIRSHFIAGCASGFAQSFVSSPTELLKLRMQIQNKCSSSKQYKSSYDCFRKIYRKGGLRSLYRGLLITSLRDTPSLGVYFAFYEYVTRQFTKDGSATTTPQLLLAGGSAGTISWLANYPIDVVKTTFQSNERHSTYLSAIKYIYRTYGMRGFFTGLNTALISLPMGPGQRTIHYLWDTSWCLAEAGTTFTEPMIHASRFM